MSQTIPPLIDPAPTPPPQRNDRTTFSDRVDAFVTWLITAVTQFGNVATNVYNNAVDAYNSALAAASSAASSLASANNAASSAAAASVAANVSKWVSGTTYTIGQVVWSPANYQNYRRVTAGAGTTDPSADFVNWYQIGFTPAWQIQSTNYTAIPGDRVAMDTTSGPLSLTLPASPVGGVSSVQIRDYARIFGTNNLTVVRSGHPIEGLAEDMTVSLSGAAFTLTYIDATKGWELT